MPVLRWDLVTDPQDVDKKKNRKVEIKKADPYAVIQETDGEQDGDTQQDKSSVREQPVDVKPDFEAESMFEKPPATYDKDILKGTLMTSNYPLRHAITQPDIVIPEKREYLIE